MEHGAIAVALTPAEGKADTAHHHNGNDQRQHEQGQATLMKSLKRYRPGPRTRVLTGDETGVTKANSRRRW
jgi:hypothetical protein